MPGDLRHDGHAELSAPVRNHEVHVRCRDAVCRNEKVGFVLTIFGVGNDDHAALRQGLQRVVELGEEGHGGIVLENSGLADSLDVDQRGCRTNEVCLRGPSSAGRVTEERGTIAWSLAIVSITPKRRTPRTDRKSKPQTGRDGEKTGSDVPTGTCLKMRCSHFSPILQKVKNLTESIDRVSQKTVGRAG